MLADCTASNRWISGGFAKAADFGFFLLPLNFRYSRPFVHANLTLVLGMVGNAFTGGRLRPIRLGLRSTHRPTRGVPVSTLLQLSTTKSELLDNCQLIVTRLLVWEGPNVNVPDSRTTHMSKVCFKSCFLLTSSDL